MIKFEYTITPSAEQWLAIIHGLRNPMNSWDKSDSKTYVITMNAEGCPEKRDILIGPNDLDLMIQLRDAGANHRKFMQMITVYVDVTAPLYWWKEFDTYKIGSANNSCSFIHQITEKEFTLGDFSCEHLFNIKNDEPSPKIEGIACTSTGVLKHVITALNYYREYYLSMIKQKVPGANERAKDIWWQMIQLLPSSYNQKRTVMLNYEVLANIYESQKNNKLDEWSIGFMDWIKSLPYSELITGEEK